MISGGLVLALALVGLAATLAVAVAKPPWLSEAVVAVVVATVLVAIGAISVDGARRAVVQLAPTVGFLAALLLLADGCRREGLFDALGTFMARGSQGRPRRLLALVFVVASGVTVALGLDPTIVLLTPVVFATATRLRMSPTPYVYACAHLANSASLLLPISNLTNLLAFHASGLSFVRFAALMALPTVAAIAVEWVVFVHFFSAELDRPRECEALPEPTRLPRLALGVVAATLVGFLVSSLLGIQPLWIAAAGAVVITVPALVRRTTTPLGVVRAVEPPFLVFVVSLGMIVAAASDHGLATAVRTVLPDGGSLPDLLGIAAVSAVLANLVNNLPAILILAPLAALAGHGPVLAALVGVNVGPNLTYVGSLATLLWRRLLRAEDVDVNLAEFSLLGAITVPAALVASTVLLWSVLRLGVCDACTDLDRGGYLEGDRGSGGRVPAGRCRHHAAVCEPKRGRGCRPRRSLWAARPGTRSPGRVTTGDLGAGRARPARRGTAVAWAPGRAPGASGPRRARGGRGRRGDGSADPGTRPRSCPPRAPEPGVHRALCSRPRTLCRAARLARRRGARSEKRRRV